MADSEYEAILDEARAQIARGVEPDAAALEARIGAVRGGDAEHALAQLRRLLSVHRARALLVDRPAPSPSPRRPAYRARPTIAANVAVRARRIGDMVTLEWDPAPGVASWEARLSERPDARSDYVERETLTLEGPRLELRLPSSRRGCNVRPQCQRPTRATRRDLRADAATTGASAGANARAPPIRGLAANAEAPARRGLRRGSLGVSSAPAGSRA